MKGERESRREGRAGWNEVGRVRRREGVREGITKGGREGVIGGREREREGEKGREGRNEVWRVKQKEGGGGYYKKREGVVGGRTEWEREGGKGERDGRGYGG